MGEKSSLRRRKGHSGRVAECEAGVGACRPYPYRDLITIEELLPLAEPEALADRQQAGRLGLASGAEHPAGHGRPWR